MFFQGEWTYYQMWEFLMIQSVCYFQNSETRLMFFPIQAELAYEQMWEFLMIQLMRLRREQTVLKKVVKQNVEKLHKEMQ